MTEMSLKIYFRISSKAIYIETYNLLMRLVVASRMRDCKTEFVLDNHRLPDDVILAGRNTTFDLYKGNDNISFSDYVSITEGVLTEN